MGLNIEEQKAVERFRKEVVDPSQTKLVVLDFWAEWCGPCKALTPVLEKVCAEYADKGVVLTKINVDEERFIAEQFQVKSIPTVYAMFQGQPVADLTPARSESQLKGALDQILSQLPIDGGEGGAQGPSEDDQVEQLLAMGEEMVANGQAAQAADMFTQVIAGAPPSVSTRPAVQAGLIGALLAADRTDDAKTAYDGLPQEVKDDPALAQVKASMDLAESSVDDSELQALRAAAVERPADMEAQMAFAEAAFAARSRDEAAEVLLKMIETDPEWNEGAAKAKLLQVFEAVGLEDPWVAAQRRKLSLLLFG